MICRIDGEHGDGVVVVPVKPASRGHPCHGFTAGVSGGRSQVIPSANSRRHPPRGACPPSSCVQRRWEGRCVPARRRSAAAIPAHEADLQRDPPAAVRTTLAARVVARVCFGDHHHGVHPTIGTARQSPAARRGRIPMLALSAMSFRLSITCRSREGLILALAKRGGF